MRKSKSLTRLAISISAILAGAQAQAAENPAGIEEIIVTARQRAESITDVPASVQAFTANDIASAGIARPQDFIALTPGVSQVQTAEVGDLQVNIRGINTGRDAETNFALVIDGVLQTNPNAFNQELSNVTQIEVLKGPQGAVYGRNAVAGAIIMTTKKPGDEAEADLRAGVGNHGQYNGNLLVSGPLTDRIGGSIGVYTRHDDGSFKNSYLGCDDCANYFRETGVTGRLVFELNDKSSLDFKAKYSQLKAGAINFNASVALKDIGEGTPLYEQVNDHKFVYLNNVKPINEQENKNLSLKGDFDVGIGTLTAVLAYNDQTNFFLTDGTSDSFGLYNALPLCQQTIIDRTADTPPPAPFFYGGFPPPYSPTTCGGYQYQQRDQKDTSFELRLTSPSDQPLRWQGGLYYADIKRRVVVSQGSDLGQGFTKQALVLFDGKNPTDLLYDDDFESKVAAVFGQIAYDVTPNVEVAFAARYDREKRTVDNNVPKIAPQTFGFGAFGFPVCSSVGVDGPEGCSGFINPFYNVPANAGLDSIPSRSRTFSQFQPKLSVNWKVAEGWSLFASYGYGFRSGGFNSSGSAATLLGPTGAFSGLTLDDGTPNLQNIRDDYKKEVSKAAEAGFKAILLDRTLALNGAIFYTKVEDMQFFNFFAGPFGLLRVVTNIDKVDIKGAEFDARWRATEMWSFVAGFGYTDGEIKKSSVRPYAEGNEVPYAPKYTGNLGAEFTVPLASTGLNLVTRLDATFVGDTWFSEVQKNRLPNFFTAFGFGQGEFSKQKRDAYATLDARLGVQGDNWGVTAWGRNITDKKYLAEVIPAPEFGGSFIHDSPGRAYGLDVNFKF
jgi:iron complex outermembrane receptor protein